MIKVNLNNFIKNNPQQRIIKNITRECECSPAIGTPEYDEWKKTYEVKWSIYKKNQEEMKNLLEKEKILEKEKKTLEEKIQNSNFKENKDKETVEVKA